MASGALTIPETGNPEIDFYLPRWQKRFYQAPSKEFPGVPRLVNHFKLGADPEFILVDPGQPGQMIEVAGVPIRTDATPPARVNASGVGLLTGLFVGADQNGRLVEVRPKPSRFALRVLASILISLRWVAILKPELLAFEWKSGAFLEGDGLGGHIHFGRKRGSRAEEIVGLDAIAATFRRTKAFSISQWDKRLLGDDRNQQYGKFSDYRLQGHGYEYRTLPSWLDSPWTAYLSLVVSKLAVYNPKLVERWFQDSTVKEGGIRNLLAYYKELDDDARIAYLAFERLGMPVYVGKDIRAAWGLLYPTTYPQDVDIWPQSVGPNKEEVEDCFKFLVEGVTLKPKHPVVNWPARPPEGFRSLRYNKMSTGMGELTWDLVTHRDIQLSIFPEVSGNDAIVIRLPFSVRGLYKQLTPLGAAYVTRSKNQAISVEIPRFVRKSPAKIAQLRKILCEKLPIWRFGDATLAAAKPWLTPTEMKQYKTKLIKEY